MEDKMRFVDKFSAQLVHWDHELDELKICVTEMASARRADLLDRVADLHARKVEAKTNLARLMESSKGDWREARTGIESSWNELESAFASAWARLWEEEPPHTAA